MEIRKEPKIHMAANRWNFFLRSKMKTNPAGRIPSLIQKVKLEINFQKAGGQNSFGQS
jgi:hypothetical protein